MNFDYQASQDIVNHCISRCTFSKDGWRYSTEAVFLDDTGLSQICMRRCVEVLKNAAAEASAVATNAAFGAGKQVLEIATKGNQSTSYGLVAVTLVIVAIGAGYLYSRQRKGQKEAAEA